MGSESWINNVGEYLVFLDLKKLVFKPYGD